MGDGRIFLKNPVTFPSLKSYRMSLLSAGSISLDSTFKEKLRKNVKGGSYYCYVSYPAGYGGAGDPTIVKELKVLSSEMDQAKSRLIR